MGDLHTIMNRVFIGIVLGSLAYSAIGTAALRTELDRADADDPADDELRHEIDDLIDMLVAERNIQLSKRFPGISTVYTLSLGHNKYAWLKQELKAVPVTGFEYTFETSKYKVEVVHSDREGGIIKTFITLPKIDLGILLVSAAAGEFESDTVIPRGMTRIHATVAKKLGIAQIIVVVIKMETTVPPFSQARFDVIKKEMGRILMTAGYDPQAIAVIPAATDGDNILAVSDNMPWYMGWNIVRKANSIVGKTLEEAVDAMIAPTPDQDRPLRLPIQDVYKIAGRGTCPEGRVEYGTLRPEMRATFAPSGLTAGIGNLEMHHESREMAEAGETVSFKVKNVSVRELKRGMVAGDADNDPPKEAVSFKALVFIMNHPNSITVGYSPVLDIHTAHTPCSFASLDEKIDPVSGASLELNPPFLKTGDAAIVTLTPVNPMCVETFSDYPSLGRFAVRDFRLTVAVGLIQSVVKKENDGKVTISGGKKN